MLDHHHRDPATKSFNITGAAFGKGLAALTAEIAKCVVLCANCHRLVHAGLLEIDELGETDDEPQNLRRHVSRRIVQFGGL